jgi:hypothetical protein
MRFVTHRDMNMANYWCSANRRSQFAIGVLRIGGEFVSMTELSRVTQVSQNAFSSSFIGTPLANDCSAN